MAIRSSSLDRTFQALGDRTRRGMLGLLARRGECTAGQLGAPFSVSQPTASRHLRVLERAGLVRRQVRGRRHHFQLVEARLNEAEQWIARHRQLWTAALDRLSGVLDDAEAGP